MANNSKYFWIKLKTDFFNQETIDFLMSQKNGCEYIVLYQMLCLNTANTNGQLLTNIGELIVPYDINKIVRDTKYFDFDTVTVAIELFKKLGLIFENKDNILTISGYDEMIGKNSDRTNNERQKRFRERQKLKKLEAKETADNNVISNVTHNVTHDVKNNTENRDKRLEIRDKRLDYRDESVTAERYTCEEETSSPSPSSLIDQLIFDYGNDAVSNYIQRVKDWYTKHHKKLEETEFDETVARWMREDGVAKIDHDVDKYKCLINKF